MIQHIFFVDGLKEPKDEAPVLEATKQVFGQAEIKVNAMTSSLIVTLPSDTDTEDAVKQLKAALQELGYTLKLPPNRVDISEPSHIVEHLDFKAADKQGRKAKRRVPWSAFVASTCALLIVAVLGTYAIATAQFNQQLIDIEQAIWDSVESEQQPETPEPPSEQPPETPELPDASSFPELEIFKFLFDQNAIEDIDQETLLETVLKAYVAGTGDIYAEYYTAEEFEALNAENRGEMEGVGVSVTNDRVEINGLSYQVMTVINVFDNSPALKAGVRVGDHIYTVTNAEGEEFTVDELGYDRALACVRGISGTAAEFSVVRFSAQEADPKIIPFSIIRAPITAETVTSRVLSSDPQVGIVKISQFDLTTPRQFHSKMDALIEQGCTKFVFDVRYNPGGLLQSVKAVLSTLLDEGDAMISIIQKNEPQITEYVTVVENPDGPYSGCSVSQEDIGKYSGYDFVVLVNEYTASAAELFAANIRDHELGTLVGEITYGKGCIQSIYDLSFFGIEGGLKFTTAWYMPPCGENYHGIGITPDVAVETDATLMEQYGSIYLIPDERDPQIQAAIQAINQ